MQPSAPSATSLISRLEVCLLTQENGLAAVSRKGTNALTTREDQILGLVAQGLTNAGVGNRLGISRNAVRNHLTRIAVKLNLQTGQRAITRVQLAGWWLKRQYAEWEYLRTHMAS